jgi:hypothetical protein
MAAKKNNPPPTDSGRSDAAAPPAGGSTERVPFTTLDAETAFHHFASTLAPVPSNEIEILRGDVELIKHNIRIGSDNLAQHWDLIRLHQPLTPVPDILELPALSLALIFARDRVTDPASEGEIADRLSQLRPLRDIGLRQLEIFADLGMIPNERVTKIRAGTGPLDAARDGIAIAGAFNEFRDVVTNKHPLTSQQLTALADLGNWLVVQLKPADAVTATSANTEPDDARVSRDRLFTEIVRRHEMMRVAGVVPFGLRRLDEMVPPLLARVRTAPAKTPPTPSTPGK